jgi:putative membrane protein
MRSGIFVTTVVLTSLALWAQQEYPKHPQKPERTITATPSDNNTVKGIDETDRKFMKEAAIGDQEEIKLGQMAQDKAADPSVKSFGQRMVKDHSSADDKLKNIAQSQHISLPNSLDSQHKNDAAALSRLSGAKFDKAYMQLMVKEHTKDVNKFKKEAATAHDGTIKQFASGTLPVLESHLKEAKQLQQKVDRE